jgi:hypothetical protein
MRRLVLVAVTALLLSALPVTPAGAQAPSATGSCGYAAGQYGLDALAPREGYSSVGTWHFQGLYSGVTPGTPVKVVIFYNDELESHVATVTQTASSSSGAVAGALLAGGEAGGNTTSGKLQGLRPNRGGLWGGDSHGAGKTAAVYSGHTVTTPVVGPPGLYAFYVLLGDQQIGRWTCAIIDQ